MRKAEHSKGGSHKLFTLLLGALLAFGIELVVLLLGAVAVSSGILREDVTMQTTAAACLLGCLLGGAFAAAQWDSRRLFAGLLTGLICYLFIIAIALISKGGIEFGTQALVELAGCLIGGGLAGVIGGRKKHKRQVRR